MLNDWRRVLKIRMNHAMRVDPLSESALTMRAIFDSPSTGMWTVCCVKKGRRGIERNACWVFSENVARSDVCS